MQTIQGGVPDRSHCRVEIWNIAANYYLIARESKLGTIIIGRRKGWREGVEERVIGKMEREVSSRRDGSN